MRSSCLRAFVVACVRVSPLLAVCIATFAGGCTSKHEPTTAAPGGVPPDARALKPVDLPDLTNAAPAVQQQIRERFASLTQKTESAGTPGPQLADAYGEMGRLFIATEYLDAAESCFLNAYVLAPGDMRWPYHLGHVHRFKNEPVKAAAFFEQAVQLDRQQNTVAPLVWLAEMRLAQGHPETAEPLFTQALARQPRTAAALYGLGRAALERNANHQAVEYFEAALALAPKASRMRYPLAMAYRGLGDRQKAEAHLARRGDVEVPVSDPLMDGLAGLLQNAAAYETRGAEALDQKKWDEAVANLRKAAELAPDNAFTRLNLGTALYLKGDAGAALEQFEAAVRLSPGLAKAHYGIGVLMEARQRDREALEHFSAAVTSEPAYVEARLSLADALRRTGRLEDSLRHYEQVIRLDPAASQAHFGSAMALVRLGRYSEARDRLAGGMKMYPDQPGFPHALARLLAAAPHASVRDGQRALALVQDLLARQKTIGLAETMAMSLAELGRYDEAARWQRDAMAAARQGGSEGVARRLAATLTLYERRQPCRTPWQDDDPVFHPRPAR